jgi:hypothetical protein
MSYNQIDQGIRVLYRDIIKLREMLQTQKQHCERWLNIL